MTRENGQQDQMSSLQATLERFIARTDEAFERMDKQVAVDRAEWRQQLAANEAAWQQQLAANEAAWQQQQAENRAEWQQQLAENRAEWQQQQAEGRAAWQQQLAANEATWQQQQAEDRAAWRQQLAANEAEWQQQQAEGRAAWQQQQAEDRAEWQQQLAANEAAWQQQQAEDRAAWQRQQAEFQNKQEEERRKEQKAWNKRWGDLANRLGTVVEDIVAPNIPRIGRQYFGLDSTPEDFSVRRKVMHKSIPGKNREFDTIAVYPEAIILNDTKETVRQVYLDDYVAFIEANEFFDYFPEYRGRKLIPIFSSLYLADAAVNYLSKHKIYAMAMGDETMQLLNFQRVSRG